MRNERPGMGTSIRESFGNAVRFIVWDWSTLLFFELIYKFILLAALMPLGKAIMSRALKEAGVALISEQNVSQLFSNPVSPALIALWLLLLAFAVYVEICALLLYFESARKKQRLGALVLLSRGTKRSLALFRGKRAAMIPFLLVLIPFTGFGISSGPLRELRIPEYIREHIAGEPALLTGSVLLFAAVCLFVFFRMFSVPEVVLEDGGFREACRRSRLLMRGRAWRTLLCLLCWSLIYSAAALCVCLAVMVVLFAWAQVFYSGETAVYAFWFACSRLWSVGGVLASIYVMTCNLGMTTALYYQYHGGKPACVRPVFPEGRYGKEVQNRRRMPLAMRALALVLLFMLYAETAVLYNQNWNTISRTQIVAHRGGALFAPENTLSAIREAGGSGAEYAEIDVRQTKDGQLIALHDSTFRRNAGVSQRAEEVTLREAKGFDVGLSFSYDFAGERVPTLEEILETARGRLGLMIELKGNSVRTSGDAEGMEERTVRLIREAGMERQCVVGAMDYSVLRRVKAIAPEIRTVYIMAVAYGDFEELKAADMLSIEESFVTPEVIGAAHSLGKPVFVWTVNREKTMRKLILMGVDGIVTDNPWLAGYVRETKAMDSFSSQLALKF